MRGAFSLVEVTLAIGVVAFAFVGLLGLLPTGLNVFRQAMDTSVTSQISQRLATELQESDFYALLQRCNLNNSQADPTTSEKPSYGTLPPRYFDDQGNEVKVASPGNPSEVERLRALYEVRIRITRGRDKIGYNVLTKKDDPLGSRNMATAMIQVVNNPAGKDLVLDESTQLVDTAKTKLPTMSYPVLISRSGSEAKQNSPHP